MKGEAIGESGKARKESFLKVFFSFCSAVAWTTKCISICNVAYMYGQITYLLLIHELRIEIIDALLISNVTGRIINT